MTKKIISLKNKIKSKWKEITLVLLTTYLTMRTNSNFAFAEQNLAKISDKTRSSFSPIKIVLISFAVILLLFALFLGFGSKDKGKQKEGREWAGSIIVFVVLSGIVVSVVDEYTGFLG